MKKIFILTLSFLMLYGFSYSQDVGDDDKDKQEEAASVNEESEGGKYLYIFSRIDVSVLFGRDNFLENGLHVPYSISSGGSSYGGHAPSILGDLMNSGGSSAVSMVGVQGRFYINDDMAIKISGGALVSKTPGREYVQGYTPDPSASVGNAGVIPNKLAVKEKTDFLFNTTLGFEYNFKKKNLSPYLGVGIPFYYVRKSLYDPTFRVDKYGNIYIADVGVRIAEMFGVGAHISAGIDYYLRDNLYFGFEIKPYSFVYAYMAEHPAPGIPKAESNTTAHGFFTQPFFKLGFVF